MSLENVVEDSAKGLENGNHTASKETAPKVYVEQSVEQSEMRARTSAAAAYSRSIISITYVPMDRQRDNNSRDFFAKLEDVLYRCAHRDTRAIRGYEYMHDAVIAGYALNKHEHLGESNRSRSRKIVAGIIGYYDVREQQILSGILHHAGYDVHSTDALINAVNDLYRIFQENIRRDKRRDAVVLRSRLSAAALLYLGWNKHNYRNHNGPQPGPQPNPPDPIPDPKPIDKIHGGHIRDGLRVDSRN